MFPFLGVPTSVVSYELSLPTSETTERELDAAVEKSAEAFLEELVSVGC